MAKKTSGRARRGDELGHLLVMWKGKFYFIPADRVGPPITLTGSDLSAVMANIGFHQKNNSDDLIDFGLRVDELDNLIKVTGHN